LAKNILYTIRKLVGVKVLFFSLLRPFKANNDGTMF
jgi:hypothetical protein